MDFSFISFNFGMFFINKTRIYLYNNKFPKYFKLKVIFGCVI